MDHTQGIIRNAIIVPITMGEIIFFKNNMDDEVFEKAKEEDMTKDEAEELQDLMQETGLDIDEAYELWQEL